MKARPTDAQGDLLPVARLSCLAEGKEAVARAVHDRLHLAVGEWWEDETVGLAVPSVLFDGLRMPLGEEMLLSYLSGYLEETEGVLSVEILGNRFENRKLSMEFSLQTADGTLQQEVREDVLLFALS